MPIYKGCKNLMWQLLIWRLTIIVNLAKKKKKNVWSIKCSYLGDCIHFLTQVIFWASYITKVIPSRLGPKF